jgi:Tol biopolymer transport system component
LSPDGLRLAYGLADSRTASEDIWVRDLKREVSSRATFDPKDEIWPVWSRDGNRFAYSSDRDGLFSIFIRDANGIGGDRELLADHTIQAAPLDFSPDGKWLAINVLPASRRWQVKMLPLQGDPKPVDYLTANVSQLYAKFSPNGRFVAYVSSESGTREVYVQSFPTGAGKWQISSGGGETPQWRADGKELFFKSLADDFVAVPVSSTGAFEAGIPKVLFKRAIDRTAAAATGVRWTVTADGQKFLINASRGESRGQPVSVILGWPATLAQR